MRGRSGCAGGHVGALLAVVAGQAVARYNTPSSLPLQYTVPRRPLGATCRGSKVLIPCLQLILRLVDSKMQHICATRRPGSSIFHVSARCSPRMHAGHIAAGGQQGAPRVRGEAAAGAAAAAAAGGGRRRPQSRPRALRGAHGAGACGCNHTHRHPAAATVGSGRRQQQQELRSAVQYGVRHGVFGTVCTARRGQRELHGRCAARGAWRRRRGADRGVSCRRERRDRVWQGSAAAAGWRGVLPGVDCERHCTARERAAGRRRLRRRGRPEADESVEDSNQQG